GPQGRTTMDKYLAIDVHLQSCTLAVVSPTGKRLQMQIVETNGLELIQRVRQIPGRKHLVIEEGTHSEWLFETLSPYVEEMVITVPNRRAGNKSDAGDAWALAEQLRRRAIDVRVYKPPADYSGLRAAARAYRMLTEDVVRVKNRLKAVFRSRGMQAGSELWNPESRKPAVDKLPQAQSTLARLLGEELDAVTQQRETAEEWLHREGSRHPCVQHLTTAPGIGPIRAAQITAIVVTPHRFRTKRQFWSYCGLGIVMRSSADWVPQGKHWVRRRDVTQTRGLNRNRRPELKSVFKGAAHSVIHRMHDRPLNLEYQRMLAAGMKPDLAKLTLARRIAATVLAMWKAQEDYDPDKHARNIRR
ncbi:MAG TPA: transposase, partial [Thermoanaerobaculia bacterium]|nr:transposase [Thermoanaerobaculia bacterium]